MLYNADMTLHNQIMEVSALNERSLPTIIHEYGEENPTKYLANGCNFQENVYYHNCVFREDKKAILKNGFDFERTSGSHLLGKGLFCGRDRKAVMSFYTFDLSKPEDNILTIKGSFNFLNLVVYQELESFLKKFYSPKFMRRWTLNNGYDGIRYYDLYCTGEEFVLYNLDDVSIS